MVILILFLLSLCACPDFMPVYFRASVKNFLSFPGVGFNFRKVTEGCIPVVGRAKGKGVKAKEKDFSFLKQV